MNREIVKLRIRDILTQRGMTCRQLAELAGKSPQYINSILNDPKSLSINALIAIANALNVEFGDLFVSSFSPSAPNENEFVALVKCRKGVFRADSIDELQNVVNTLSNRSENAIELMKRTLERTLRFPDTADRRIVTELIADLSRCMNPNEWHHYYKETITGLLPLSFEMDWSYLATFMTPSEIESLERSLL